ncbi:MAG TPA: helix-turn-helix transcriptional regulator [Solirubrobacterales bacterium]|jgi:transcriptional regulator with XRE-family HTH domain|nr:helix-turn-helix transcriptional regulator [Solirubrobacterales bacterium]
MAKTQTQPEIGSLLREWREHRRVTQLALALDAGVSTRHLSFVETGRSQPGREMLLRVLEQLEVPFREQNRLLLAAGHAPAYPERSLEDSDLTPVREALDAILSGHEPYPAVAVDRAWNMVAANASMLGLAEAVEIAPELLEPPINVIRVGLHPRGLGPLFVNLGHWHTHWLKRLEHQLAVTGDEQLASLVDEIAGYPVPEPDATAGFAAGEMLGPVRVRAPDGGELSFFGMFASFDTPFEVTTSELAVELLFPADRTTAETLRERESSLRRTRQG